MPEGGDIVLVGGGHAHAVALLDLAAAGLGGRVILVSPRRDTPYSGLLPGHIAGLYPRDAIHIDLESLCRRAGAAFVVGAAVGLDRAGRCVRLGDGRSVRYGVVSIDIGIEPDLEGLAGARDHAIAVKPIANLLPRFDAMLEQVREGSADAGCVVIGGGAAGVELALALKRRLAAAGGSGRTATGSTAVTLVAASGVLPTLAPRAASLARWFLATAGITVLEGRRAIEVAAASVRLDDGRRLPCSFAVVSTAARAAGWLAATGLPVERDGSLRVGPTLQVEDTADVFAAGDCATMVHAPREKAGVFAVKQGPVLAANLAAVLAGRPLRAFDPQKRFLVLIGTADGRAIAARGRWAFSGRWAWWLKDRIDRGFMARFED